MSITFDRSQAVPARVTLLSMPSVPSVTIGCVCLADGKPPGLALVEIEEVEVVVDHRVVRVQPRAANRSGAVLALVAGDHDINAGTVGVKDLATGEQVAVPAVSAVAELLSRLAL
jgi:hypothetical protein